MNCERCHKNHATTHVTDKVGDVMKEAHLCDECVRQTGVPLNSNFSIGEILGTFMQPTSKPATNPRINQVRCPECGITYAEFKTKARLGCANDYEVFRSELLRLLEKIHGSTQHAGKTPHTADASIRKENELIKLKRDLEVVVKSEDFEKAAQIRDRIKNLELELNR
jgi:protein arginine kinase activator